MSQETNPKTPNAQSSQGFNENYKVLRDIAETLRRQEEPDIDALVPMVAKASQAYAACRERLDAVRLALQEHLPLEKESTENIPENKN